MIDNFSSRQKCRLFMLTFALLFPLSTWAEPGLMEYKASAHRTFGSIEIDGELTEADWQRAEPITQLVQIQPDEGKAMTEPTEIRILYDDRNLYFGFTCYDSEMSRLVANEMRRDAQNAHENDNVFVLLDTYNDKRSAVFFRINPLGAVQDTAVGNSGESLNQNWDVVWNARAKINGDHWVVEAAIPFSQLRFERSDEMTWGMNVGRKIARKQEEATWVPVPGVHGGWSKYRTHNLGQLVGLKGIKPSRHLELLPYILPGTARTRDDEGGLKTTGVFDFGLDVKYGITSNLTADLTFNTDFAQVEADQEQVNLTRFSLFFPERRPFFLEGAGLFDFGIPRISFDRPPPVLLFYSRRIGLAKGKAIPIIEGGKVTGKVGPYGVGLLNVLTDQFSSHEDPDERIDVPRTNYAVLRVTRDIFNGSRIGLIAVNKQVLASGEHRDAGAHNRAGGFDFSYRPLDNLNIDGLWARTSEADDAPHPNAWYLGGTWRPDTFRLEGSTIGIGEGFNPEVGFVQRKGIRQFHGEAHFTPRPGRLGIREIWSGPQVDFILNEDNKLDTRELMYINWLGFERGGFLFFSATNRLERLEEGFEIRDGILIPTGTYRFSSLSAAMQTAETKMLSSRFGFEIGDFYDGTKRGFGIGMSFKPTGRLSLEPWYRFNRVNLPGGDFSTSLFGARVNYSFSTLFFAKLFAQWNTDSRIVSTNFLVNYIYRPGSDFFLVFNQIYDTGDDNVRLEDATVVAKMTYWWNP